MRTLQDSTGHDHRCELDGNGNGETIDTNGGKPHTHKVEDYKVLPGGEDDHIHEMDPEGVKAYQSSTAHWKAGDAPTVKSDDDQDGEKMKALKEKSDPLVKVTIEVGGQKNQPAAEDS